MKINIALSLLLLELSAFCTQANPIVVGYFPDWGASNSPSYTYKQVNWTQITHIAWSFMFPSASGTLDGLDSSNSAPMDSLIANAHSHNVKTILSLGGAGNCTGFAPMASSAATRALFIHRVKTFVLARKFDGVDIDWEYSANPSASDTAAYTKLINDLRDSLGTNLLLTAALPCSDWWAKWFSINGFINSLDWAGIMTYDITGDWDTQTEYNSPLYPNKLKATYSFSQGMQYWTTTRGVSKAKLLGGIPTYGVYFTQSAGPGLAFSGSVYEISYQAFQDSLVAGKWTTHFDDTAMVPWAASAGGAYLTYENTISIGAKAKWISDNGYPGVIVWELSEDYSPLGKNPLLDTLAKGLGLTKPSAVLPRSSHTKFAWTQTSNRIRVYGVEAESVALLDMQGSILRAGSGQGANWVIDLQGVPRGLAILRVHSESGVQAQAVLLP